MSEPARILVVDDEAANRRLLSEILKREGFVVGLAEHGRECLEQIKGGGVDLVLLDVMMPVLDGIATCSAIRSELALPLLPVVLVTALNDHASRARGKEAGADDFLTKPVYKEELLARVRVLLKLKHFHDDHEAQRANAASEARKWRIVSRVAQEVGSAADFDEVRARLVSALGDDLPIDEPEIAGAGGSAEPPDDGAVRIPLSIAGDDDGILVVRARLGAPMNPKDAALIALLAPHLANALARARLAETRSSLDVARRRLTGLLVHDLKGPLGVIKANLEHIRSGTEGGLDEEVRAAADDAITGAAQIQRMVLDLLDVGLAEEGRLPFVPEPGDLGGVVSSAAGAFRPILQGQRASLRISVAAGLPLVSFDRALIVRVLQNLLGNAARFVPVGGGVEVEVCARGEHVVIMVGNDGPSIPAEVRSALFEKFGQVTGNQRSDNRGLGLYLCRLVAEQHRGTILVKERAEGGASFEVALPLGSSPGVPTSS